MSNVTRKKKNNGFIERYIPNFSGEEDFWLDFDAVRRDLFSIVRKAFSEFPYELRGKDFAKALDSLRASTGAYVIETWKKIESHFRDSEKVKRLKGATFEALFYMSVLTLKVMYTEAQEMIDDGYHIGPEIPWYVEVLPIFEITPRMLLIDNGHGGKERYAPQAEADFVVLRRNPDDTTVTALIDVKSYEPEKPIRWPRYAAFMSGAILELAFPKKGIEFPMKMDDWEIEIVCPMCGKWPIEDYVCTSCNANFSEKPDD